MLFMFHVCLCYVVLPYDHLLGKDWPLGSLASDVYVTFPCGVPGQVWYLSVSIADFWLLLYFE